MSKPKTTEERLEALEAAFQEMSTAVALTVELIMCHFHCAKCNSARDAEFCPTCDSSADSSAEES